MFQKLTLAIAMAVCSVIFSSQAQAISCAGFSAACATQCNRFNNSTANIQCWCSGKGLGCYVDAALCANADTIQGIALAELLACAKANPKPPVAPKCVPVVPRAGQNNVTTGTTHYDSECVDEKLLEEIENLDLDMNY